MAANVLVMGSAGNGKSTLIHALYREKKNIVLSFTDTLDIGQMSVMPENQADVILFVLNAERFCSSEEIRFIIDYLWDRREDIFFVVNKYDHIKSESKEKVQKYAQKKLKVYGGRNICFVSAKEGLKAKMRNDIEKYRSSGMEELQNRILEFLEKKNETESISKQTLKTEGFSWENISEITDFENHLAFLEMMIDKYKWKPEIKSNLTARLKNIKAKQQDKKLNLSVIGDFNTGKSTFINALLRTELLLSSSIQGSTAISTIIEYSDDYAIKLYYKNHIKKNFQFRNIQELKDMLGALDSATAQRLHHIRVYLPSQPLIQNIRVVDTPGTNAIEQWHEEVTVRTISGFSDLSIILVNASRPLPETFCHFIENHLSHILEQCVFVVTKFDVLKENEREKVITYIRQKLEKTFGLQNPLVLPYVSPYVIDDFLGNGLDTVSASEFLKMSYENEAKIFQHMAQQRVIVQTKKLIALAENVYRLMSKQMQEISDSCRNYLEFLQKTQQVNLRTFVSAQKKERELSYDTTIKEKRAELLNYFEKLSILAKKNIFEKIDKISTISELKDYLNSRIQKDCTDEARKMVEKAEQKFGYVTVCFRNEMLLFQQEFKKLYQDLNILDIDFSKKKQSFTKEIEGKAVLGSIVESAAQELSKENKAFWGGAAAGAAAGTLIAPGVGTVIGGIVGLFVGSSAAPDIKEVQKSCKEKLDVSLRKYFDDVVYKMTEVLDEYIDKTKECILEEINRYFADYKDIIEKRMIEEKRKRDSMKDSLKVIQMDMESIEKRKFRIQSISRQLDNIDKN